MTTSRPDPAELDAIRARWEAATPLPWRSMIAHAPEDVARLLEEVDRLGKVAAAERRHRVAIRVMHTFDGDSPEYVAACAECGAAYEALIALDPDAP